MWPFNKKDGRPASVAKHFNEHANSWKPSFAWTIGQLLNRDLGRGYQLSDNLAAIRFKQSAISQLPVVVQKKVGKHWININEIDGADIDMRNIQARPCKWLTWSDWLGICVGYMEMNGSFLTYNTFAAGKPLKFEPIVNQSGNDTNFDHSKGVKYVTMVLNEGTSIKYEFPSRYVCHFMNLGGNGVRSFSTVTQDALQRGLIQESTLTEMLLNNETPDGIYETSEDFSDNQEAVERFKQQLGQRKKGEAMVLESDMKFKPLRLSPVDLDLLAGRSFTREQIASAHCIPINFFNDMPTTKEDIDFFHRVTITPIIERIEQTLNSKFPENYRIKLDHSKFLKGDFTSQVDATCKLVERGICSLGQAAQMLDIPVDESARNLHAISTNNQTLGSIEFLLELEQAKLEQIKLGNSQQGTPPNAA